MEHILALCTIDFSRKTVSSFIQQHWQRKHGLAKVHSLDTTKISSVYQTEGISGLALPHLLGSRARGGWQEPGQILHDGDG
jgi:hypothetical protein